MPKINKPPTETELYSRFSRQCSISEYAPADIKQKVLKAGLSSAAAERIIEKLTDEDFINESRYTKAFVHDKFELNHWGRKKIEAALAQKGIRGTGVQEQLANIDEDRYKAVLTELITTKNKSIRTDSNQERFQKLLAFAASRGFELSIAYDVLETIIRSEN
ncbi:MAG: RecX family transcriptional regulator [Bacteroidaceae bacterium]|nr:RecX family transcriptional regulator [Bacteroidaceae bacterium]